MSEHERLVDVVLDAMLAQGNAVTEREAERVLETVATALDVMGWVCVPREATAAELDAARDWSAEKYGEPIGNDAAQGCRHAMLTAAPRSPLEAGE